MSGGEVIVILVVALIVFGPKRLRELARAIGKLMHDLNRSMRHVKAQIEAETEETGKDVKDKGDKLSGEKNMTENKSVLKDKD